MTISAGLTTLTQARMLDAMSKAADWTKWDGRKKKLVPTDPPALPASILLSRVGEWNVPTLGGVITSPTLRPDGTMLHAPGYDPVTRLYHAVNAGLTPAYVPEQPTMEQATESLKILDDLLDEFPFVAPVDRVVALSGLMTPILRGAIPVAPLHAIKASTAGTGKSYLVDTASAIAAGRACPVISVSTDAKETESRINGLLLGGFPLVSLDNVNGELGGDLLSQALTQPVVQVRRLGGSDIFEVVSRATWFATGNGLRVKGDMTRRTVICNLDAGVERPEMRQFHHSPLDDVLAERGRFIAAVLTIARAYVAAGKPGRLTPPASYEEWSDLVRSPLVWLGCADPWSTTEAAREDDPELMTLRIILTGLAEATDPGDLLPARRIIELANAKSVAYDGEPAELLRPDFRATLMEIAGVKGTLDPLKISRWLMSREGRIVDGLRIKRGRKDGDTKAARWVVERP